MYGPKPARNFSTRAGGSGAPPEEISCEGGEVLPGDVRVGGERHEGGGRADGVGGPVLGEGVQDDARLEAVGEDQGARVGDAGGELADHAGDVEERREREVAGALGEGVAGALALRVVGDVALGFMAPLGVPLVPEV